MPEANGPMNLVPGLLNNGYKVIPIRDDNRPCFPGFLQHDVSFSVNDAELWLEKWPSSNVALVCGYNDVVALDFDIDDPELSKKLKGFMIRNFNYLPIRISGSDRFAMIFRGNDEVAGMNIKSNEYELPDGRSNQIEVIGNRIITAYGKHRKTKQNYKWLSHSLVDTTVDSLPQLTMPDVKKVLRFFHSNVPDSWKIISKYSATKRWKNKVTFETVENLRLKMKFTQEEIDQIVNYKGFNGNSRHTWRQTCYAIKSFYGEDEKGFEIFNDWSKKFSKYKSREDCRELWAEALVDGGYTMGHKYKEMKVMMAEERAEANSYTAQPADSPVDEFNSVLDNCVFISTDSKVGDLRNFTNESLLSLSDWTNKNNKYSVLQDRVDGRNGQVTQVPVPIPKIWKSHPDRIDAFDTAYVPNAPRLIQPGYWHDKNEVYYNKYIPPIITISKDDNLVPIFYDHLKYLFPNKGHEWVLNWMAHMIQHPEQRYRTAPFSISLYQRTGRGWLANLMANLIGPSNYTTLTKLEDMIRPGAKSGYLVDSILMVVNEVYIVGRQKYGVNEHLKTLLGDNYQETDVKYGKQSYNTQVFTRVFFQSNYIDGLVIEGDDTRIQPFINRNKPKADEYYENLYRLLENKDREFVNQIYTYLSTFKIEKDRLQKSEDTEDRTAVIMSNRSITGLAFHEFKQLVGTGVFTEDDLTSFLHNFVSAHSTMNDTKTVDNKALHILKKNGRMHTKDIRIKGRIHTVKFFEFENNELSTEMLYNKMVKTRNEVLEFFNALGQREDGRHDEF